MMAPGEFFEIHIDTPLADAEAFLAANPNAALTVFDKAGLLPHDEQAHAFNRFVLGHLN